MAINYERVNWDTTKYVNPENMNQMDEGIESACNGVDNLNTSVDERIGDMSTLPQPNVDLSSNITAINSTLDNLVKTKTVTYNTGAYGNVNFELSTSSHKVLSASCDTHTENVFITPFVANGTNTWYGHVQSVINNVTVVNTQLTVKVYYI